MVKKPLIDTNVCLDLLLKRNPHLPAASEIFQLSEFKTIEAVISAISYDTLSYLMQTAFTVQQTTQKLTDMASITTVGIANEAVISGALSAKWNDLEDAIQYYCAKENDCDAVITRNRKDFTPSTLQVLSPRQFLAQIDAGE